MTPGSALVRVVDVSRRFGHPPGAVAAVKHAEFEVHAGEVTLIIGPSGSGKTTLLSMIGGLLQPSSGDIVLDGVRLSGCSAADLTRLRRAKVGFIFQAFRIIDALTVTENVELPLNLAGMRRPGSRARSRAVLEQLGLGAHLDASPRTLSGGEKQRVAIARAFVNDPPLILADEPTGSLDSRSGRAAIELLRTAARDHGAAVVVVSHDPRILPYADRVLAMEDGVLRDAATPEMLHAG